MDIGQFISIAYFCQFQTQNQKQGGLFSKCKHLACTCGLTVCSLLVPKWIGSVSLLFTHRSAINLNKINQCLQGEPSSVIFVTKNPNVLSPLWKSKASHIWNNMTNDHSNQCDLSYTTIFKNTTLLLPGVEVEGQGGWGLSTWLFSLWCSLPPTLFRVGFNWIMFNF